MRSTIFVALAAAALMSCAVIGLGPKEGNDDMNRFDGAAGDKLALVSLSLDGFTETTTPMSAVPEQVRALVDRMVPETEKLLAKRFEVVPVASFASKTAYRDLSLGRAFAGTYVPTVEGQELPGFEAEKKRFDEANIEARLAEKLCAALGVKLVAVVRTKWSITSSNHGSAQGPNVGLRERFSTSETWITIYRRNGTKLLEESKVKSGGYRVKWDGDQGMTRGPGGVNSELAALMDKPSAAQGFFEDYLEGVEALVKTVKRW